MRSAKHITFNCGLLVCGFAVVVFGCGSSQEFETVPAQGRVSIDGKPLAGAKIVFAPTHGPSATAESEPDGSFILQTYGGGDGAVAGTHSVTVTARESGHVDMQGSPLMTVPGKSLIPAIYSDPTTSGLKFEVTTGQPNSFEIQLSSRPK